MCLNEFQRMNFIDLRLAVLIKVVFCDSCAKIFPNTHKSPVVAIPAGLPPDYTREGILRKYYQNPYRKKEPIILAQAAQRVIHPPLRH